MLAVHEMWTGGAMMLALGLVRGERLTPFDYRQDLAGLGLPGGLRLDAGVLAYVWLLVNAPISLVATYAYVNPVVAVFLGWLILDEPITRAVVTGGAVIVAAVAIVISVERPRTAAEEPALDPV